MTTTTQTYQCASCARLLPPSELYQDNYSGFLLCKDVNGCVTGSTRQGEVYLNSLLQEKERLEVRRTELIHLIAQARRDSNIPDPGQVEHDKWLEGIRGDEEC